MIFYQVINLIWTGRSASFACTAGEACTPKIVWSWTKRLLSNRTGFVASSETYRDDRLSPNRSHCRLTLNSPSWGSTSICLDPNGWSKIFFKPVPLGNKPPYLAVQLVNIFLLVVLHALFFARERFRHHCQCLFFLQVNLGGMNPIFCCQFVDGLLLSYGLNGYFDFKFCCVIFAYICHILGCQ